MKQKLYRSVGIPPWFRAGGPKITRIQIHPNSALKHGPRSCQFPDHSLYMVLGSGTANSHMNFWIYSWWSRKCCSWQEFQEWLHLPNKTPDCLHPLFISYLHKNPHFKHQGDTNWTWQTPIAANGAACSQELVSRSGGCHWACHANLESLFPKCCDFCWPCHPTCKYIYIYKYHTYIHNINLPESRCISLPIYSILATSLELLFSSFKKNWLCFLPPTSTSPSWFNWMK